jgi:glycosyltransferase involved in cell wall biosynthesis
MSSQTVLPETISAQPTGAAAPVTRSKASGRPVVVFVIDNMRLGGTELNAVRTAERLDREKFELRVVCLGEDGPLTQRYRAAGVTVEYLALRGFFGLSMLRSGKRFVRFLRGVRADIVHAHDIYSNVFTSAWARRAQVPVVIASQRWHLSPNPRLRLINRLTYARADAVLANSAQIAKAVTDEAGIPATKVWTITNFADESAFGSPTVEERDSRRRSWNAPPGAVVIGCVARFDPVKDHVSLLKAFALLRERRSNLFLVLVGDGETRPTLEVLVAGLGMEGAVHFAGELPGGQNHHCGFDISVLASLSEGFPNSLVEAMAAGNPVVATAVGGNVDAVIDGRTGYLVPPADPTRLAEALDRLVANPAMRASFGREGQREAQRSYGATSVLRSLEDMYGLLLRQRTR